MSPFVGLPKKPLPEKSLLKSWFPQSSNVQVKPNPASNVAKPPWQRSPGGGFLSSGYGTSNTPQAPLWVNSLFITVSKLPPERVTREPTGPAAAEPELGTLGLVLSWP